MKMSFLLSTMFLLLLQSSFAAESPTHEGEIRSSDGGNSVLRYFTISEDFRNMDATIEVHLTSIDLLLSVKVDSRNRINSVSTIYTPRETDAYKGDMTNPPELKSNTPSEEKPSLMTESTEKCSSWFEKAYTSFSTTAESLLKWLYIGIEWPRDVNQGMFSLRTVTRSDQCPVNDFANRSLVSLEMGLASKEVDISFGLDRKSPDKNALPANHTGNEANCLSTDLIASGNQTGNEANCISPDLIANGNQTGNQPNCISTDLITNGNQTGNEPNCISPDLIANGNPTGNKSNCTSSDLITNGNLTGNEATWMPPDLITNGDDIGNKSEDEKAGNEAIKGHQSMVVFLGQFKEWPALRTEFSPVDCYDGSSPSINRNNDFCDDTNAYYSAPSGIGENRIGIGDHMPVIPAGPVLKESMESSVRALLNYSFNQEEAMCPKDLLDARYWIQNDGFDHTENLTLGVEDPLKDGTIFKHVAVKIRKGELAVNKSVMCPVRSNKWVACDEFSQKKLSKHVDDSSWNFTKLLDHCNEWRRSSVVSPRAEILINAMEICMTSSNKTEPETKFCALKDTQGTSDSPWRITKLLNNSWAYMQWRKGNVSIQTDSRDNIMAKVPINEPLFCPLNPSQRSSESAPWLTMNMHNKSVDIKRWVTSNEILLKAFNFTSYYWATFETMLINWTWQNTFDVMIAFWITDYCFMAVYVTTAYIKEIMRRRRDVRQAERELEEAKNEEEFQRKLMEEERAQASQWKPVQGSGPPRKKKKHNYSNKKQNWK